jgi:hypothetical protein
MGTDAHDADGKPEPAAEGWRYERRAIPISEERP